MNNVWNTVGIIFDSNLAKSNVHTDPNTIILDKIITVILVQDFNFHIPFAINNINPTIIINKITLSKFDIPKPPAICPVALVNSKSLIISFIMK